MLIPKEDLNINILSDGETTESHGISLYSKQFQENASPGKKNLQMNSEAIEESKSRKLIKEKEHVIRSTRLEKRLRWNV